MTTNLDAFDDETRGNDGQVLAWDRRIGEDLDVVDEAGKGTVRVNRC